MYFNFLVNIIGDHANDANILDRSVHTIKKNAEALVVASKEIGLEVNADKTKWSCLKNRMQDKVTVLRLTRVSLQGWMSSNIWEQP